MRASYRFFVHASILSLALLLSSCANFFSDKEFDKRIGATESARAQVVYPGTATVFFFNERAWMQSTIYIPIPPLYYAVDGKMLAVMPLGSFARLHLQPGKHTFTRFTVTGGGLLPINVKRDDYTVNLKADTVSYVGSRNGFPTRPFNDSITPDEGKEIIASAELVQLIQSPASADSFQRRLENPEKRKQLGTTENAKGPTLAEVINSALPTPEQIGEVLEVVATVALIALIVIGGGGSTENPTSTSYSAHQAQATSAYYAAPQKEPSYGWQTLKTRTGVSTTVDTERKEATYLNTSSGVSYRVSDTSIYGSDGSRYRVLGSMIFSDTGQTYQIIGNNLYSSDGRTCTKTGVIVSCK